VWLIQREHAIVDHFIRVIDWILLLISLLHLVVQLVEEQHEAKVLVESMLVSEMCYRHHLADNECNVQ